MPPRLCGTIILHKPRKNLQVTVSTKETPPYRIAKCLVDIIHPTLNKSQQKVKNSRSFVLQVKTWRIEADEIQVSYHFSYLYPSIKQLRLSCSC